jgi:hypothetical protein
MYIFYEYTQPKILYTSQCNLVDLGETGAVACPLWVAVPFLGEFLGDADKAEAGCIPPAVVALLTDQSSPPPLWW